MIRTKYDEGTESAEVATSVSSVSSDSIVKESLTTLSTRL